ncbi:CSRN2 protein, partial [Alopecoenas beccarii]|nr:CSRN2 protein [Alopecoenas beccarii]
MKLELESKRQGGRSPDDDPGAGGHGSAGEWPVPPAPETQDFQEFMAENESAVLHLQSAEELERLKAEEDSGDAPGAADLGVCIVEEALAAPGGALCPPLAAPILIQAPFPPGSSVLCFAEGDRPFSDAGSLLYYPLGGGKGDGGAAEPPPPSSSSGEQDPPGTKGETAKTRPPGSAAPAPSPPRAARAPPPL